MARPLRLELAGALYHVMAHGNGRSIEVVLRMGVIRRCSRPDPGAIIERVDAVLALCRAIDATVGEPT